MRLSRCFRNGVRGAKYLPLESHLRLSSTKGLHPKASGTEIGVVIGEIG